VIESVDISGFLPEEMLESFSDTAMKVILEQIAAAARAEWIRLAGEAFNSTKRDYINGIQPVRIKGMTATISLVGMMPNMLEEGMAEVDMHDTLLGPNVPVSLPGQRGKHERKDGGFYRSIPFRHGTPSSSGSSAMGRPYSGHEAVADAKALGRAIYAAAKKLNPTTSQPGEGSKYGGRLKGDTVKYKGKKLTIPKLKDHHKSHIYQGMIRSTKTYEKANQGQYTTFRTIATGSDGWIRPATPGKFLAKEVSAFVARIAPQSFDSFLKGLDK